jgi:16S rRNA (guanine966-N2)-methyltransferase
MGQIRIIGGQMRGRKLTVPELPGLRPTPDRVRETLFNWLAPVIMDAVCLDLFAGSGALGLEALSRGAKQVVLVDSEPTIVAHLQTLAQALKLEAAQLKIIQSDALTVLTQLKQGFNIIFLDPPFQSDLLASCCIALETSGLLADNALVYIECSSEVKDLPIPPQWEILKEKQAGQVRYALVRYSKMNPLTPKEHP